MLGEGESACQGELVPRERFHAALRVVTTFQDETGDDHGSWREDRTLTGLTCIALALCLNFVFTLGPKVALEGSAAHLCPPSPVATLSSPPFSASHYKIDSFYWLIEDGGQT